jgi:hypothetical protein
MIDPQFDEALITAAFTLAGQKGWPWATPRAAAESAGLDPREARRRYPTQGDILRTFFTQADTYALTGALEEGPTRDRLFDTLMRRFDVLQLHRPGILALLRYLPLDPAQALCLSHATVASMGKLLAAAGVPTTGLPGALRKRGLALVWAYALRAWVKDDSPDLGHTMAALDAALGHAASLATRFTPQAEADFPSPHPSSELA